MKTIKTLVLIFTTILFITACKKDESTSLWDISGKVTLKDAEVESITNMEGVKVYLLNAPFSMDTINGFFAADDILEVTQTSATGQYSFMDLLPGNYIVLPADTVNNYIFNWQESPDSIWMEASNTKSSYTINFSAPLTIPDNTSTTCTFNMFAGECLEYTDQSKIWERLNVIVSQNTRHRWGCGYLSLQSCGWYWKQLSNLTVNSSLSGTALSFTNGLLDWLTNEYKDEYRLEFYWDGKLVLTKYHNFSSLNAVSYYVEDCLMGVTITWVDD